MTGWADEHAMDHMRLIRAYPLVVVKLSRHACEVREIGDRLVSDDVVDVADAMDFIGDILRVRCNRETLEVVGLFMNEESILVRCCDTDFPVARSGLDPLLIWDLAQMVRL